MWHCDEPRERLQTHVIQRKQDAALPPEVTLTHDHLECLPQCPCPEWSAHGAGEYNEKLSPWLLVGAAAHSARTRTLRHTGLKVVPEQLF